MSTTIHTARVYLDFTTCFENLRQSIDIYNASCTSRKETIPNAMRATAETMLRLYIKQVSGKAILAGSEELPGFSTYNESLAKLRGCTARTIINHRRRLVSAGIITGEQIKGNLGLLIWFAPGITKDKHLLFQLPGNIQMRVPNSGNDSPSMKSFQALVHEHTKLKNNNRDVDKWISNKAHAGEKEKVMNTGKMGVGVEDKPKGSSLPSHSLLWMVENFWLRARAKLFPYEQWDAARTKMILNFIWETVYGKFKGDRDWNIHHQIALRRMEMVHRWLHRKPGRWIPIPEIYFDPLNKKNGFHRTWEWYLKAQHLKRRMADQRLLKSHKKQWTDLDKGKLSTTPLALLQKQQEELSSPSAEVQKAYLKMLHSRLTSHNYLNRKNVGERK
jgi:hypothetical protein